MFQKRRIEWPDPQRIERLSPGRVNYLNPLHAVELREAMRYRSKVPQIESGKVRGVAVAYVGSMKVAVTWIDPLGLPVCEHRKRRTIKRTRRHPPSTRVHDCLFTINQSVTLEHDAFERDRTLVHGSRQHLAIRAGYPVIKPLKLRKQGLPIGHASKVALTSTFVLSSADDGG